MKGLKIKVRRLQLFGCSLNFWRECVMYFDQEARCVTDYQLTIEEAGVQSSFCILHPACVLLSVCSLHFTLSLHFIPGPHSAVCSPQSASYTDRLVFTHSFAHLKCVHFKYESVSFLLMLWRRRSRLIQLISCRDKLKLDEAFFGKNLNWRQI